MHPVFAAALLELAKMLTEICQRGPREAEAERICKLVREIGELAPRHGWSERMFNLIRDVLALPVFAREPEKRHSGRGYLTLATTLQGWAEEARGGSAKQSS